MLLAYATELDIDMRLLWVQALVLWFENEPVLDADSQEQIRVALKRLRSRGASVAGPGCQSARFNDGRRAEYRRARTSSGPGPEPATGWASGQRGIADRACRPRRLERRSKLHPGSLAPAPFPGALTAR